MNQTKGNQQRRMRIRRNRFRDIKLSNLEHIVFGSPVSQDTADYIVPTLKEIDGFKNYKITKEYNLIYQNDSLTHGCDYSDSKSYNTNILMKIISENRDKKFMVIDHGRFDTFTLRQNPNCQIWPRKYFAPWSLRWLHHGSRDTSVIRKDRDHWFCFLGGRGEYVRTEVFNWIIAHSLQESNKVSYLCYDIDNRDNIRGFKGKQDLYMDTGGNSEYKHLIPFNNFESDGETPNDNEGRLAKVMPLYDCLLNVVGESHALNKSAFHTEKSLNTVLYGHLPVIISGEGSMKKLQDMGMIIPDYIKWPIWDDIPLGEKHQSKIDMIQRQLQELFSSHNINDIANDWYPYAVRNLNKLNQIEHTSADEEREICRWILNFLGEEKGHYRYLYD